MTSPYRQYNLQGPAKGSQSGFTLIELLIAITIFGFIVFFIFDVTLQVYRLRETLGTDSAFYTQVLLTSSIMERDVGSIYSPIHLTIQQQSAPPPQTDPNLPPPPPPPPIPYVDRALSSQTDFWSPAQGTLGFRVSRFQGHAQKMSFVANNHVRIYAGSTESEFLKIVYSLEQDTDPERAGTLKLVKTENVAAFAGDDFKDSPTRVFILLRGIKQGVFKYYTHLIGSPELQSFEAWDSMEPSRNHLPPSLIELELEVIGPNKSSFEGSFKMRPEQHFLGIIPNG